MPDLAKQFTREDIITAINYIEENNIQLIDSTIYDLVYEGKFYPPKEVVRWAAKLKNLPDWESFRLSGGENTNGPLIKLGFQIKSKNDLYEMLLIWYEDIVRKKGFDDESYKWKLIQEFEGKPDLQASNFTDEMKSIDYGNLVYNMAKATIKHLSEKKPEQYRLSFEVLFNENEPLENRISQFRESIDLLYRSIVPEKHLSAHHDERTIATFLTYYNPNKYTFYMDSIYRGLCKHLGLKVKKKNQKYIHYLELIEDFINNHLKNETELLKLVGSYKKDNWFSDDNLKILAQDILYRTVGKNKMEETELNQIEHTKNKKLQPLNQILFGPPGTGKTYHTINKAIQITNPEFDLSQDRQIIKAEYQRLVDEGRIVFTTFHQSMSYEDFIEGIKPYVDEDSQENSSQVLYEIQDGIFKELCKKSSFKDVISQSNVNWRKVDFYKLSLGGKQRPDIHNYCIENNLIAIWYGGKQDLNELLPIQNWEEFKNKFTKLNPKEAEETRYHIQAAYNFLKMKVGDVVVVSKGNHVIDAIGIIEGNYFFDENQPIEYLHYRKVKWLATNMNYKPDYFFNKVKISQMTIYEFYKHNVRVEAFEEMFGNVKSNNKNKREEHVLIIDEINRGNVSQIFGELITLIEPDKRLGNPESLEIMLPYSKEKFGVPPNLYIIGTMNTADRSVEALDTALRRRFSFEEMPPKYDLEELEYEIAGFPASEILRTINTRIEKLIDKDHAIGHAYFIGKDERTIVDSFYKNIIPLLQEYFFGDYGKIGLVLGRDFVRAKEKSNSQIFASFDYENESDYHDKTTYEIIDYRTGLNVSENMDFHKAVHFLMNFES